MRAGNDSSGLVFYVLVRITCEFSCLSRLVRRVYPKTLTLRIPDALHIALVQRLDCELLTFDLKMTAAARALGTRIVEFQPAGAALRPGPPGPPPWS